jgi:hypothetical protein
MKTLRRTACARNRFAARLGESVRRKSQRSRPRRGRERSRHAPDLVRAGLDVTFVEHNCGGMQRRCGRTGFGSPCRTRVCHTRSRCPQWLFWRTGRRAAAEKAKTSTAFVVREQRRLGPRRARERGSRGLRSGAGEVFARTLEWRTRRTKRWPGLRTQSL